MNKNEINEMIEAIEVLKDCQIDLDQVIERIRGAVQGTPEESTADAYTLPALTMIAREEGHGYLGKESGNLDSLMRDLDEIVQEQIALNEEAGFDVLEPGTHSHHPDATATECDLEQPDPTPEEVTQKVLKDSSEYAQKVIEESVSVVTRIENAALGIDGTEIDPSRQVKIHDQPDRVRDGDCS